MIWITSHEPEDVDEFYAEIDVMKKDSMNFFGQLKYLPGEGKMKFIIENWDKLTEEKLRQIIEG
jgi:hypothetical protein